jgi:hypothetical protein
MASEATAKKKTWIDLVDESAHTSDDHDIGDIEAISRDFVVIKRGFVNIHYYYVPINKVEGWDGKVLWLKITEDEAKSYERDVLPDPARYFVKDFPGYAAMLPDLTVVSPRYRTTPVYAARMQEQPTTYRCDLCGALFRTEDDLSGHVASSH